jgi:hypothetical protein
VYMCACARARGCRCGDAPPLSLGLCRRTEHTRAQEESARLLGHLIRSSKRLIKPYVAPILKALMPKLRDANPSVRCGSQLSPVKSQSQFSSVTSLLVLAVPVAVADCAAAVSVARRSRAACSAR